MKIGVLIPDRGGRPNFLQQCKKYLAYQVMQPHEVHIVDYEPESKDIDVTQRYRRGCEHLFRNEKCDSVLFMENDDWYHPAYIATMIAEWEKANRPEIFGIGNTIYYHIILQKYFTISHPSRASAMSTLVTPSILNMNWPRDNNPYLDTEMWAQLKGKTFIPKTPICIGIKHGIGLVGGGAHQMDSAHYKTSDESGAWLRSHVGDEAMGFYSQMQREEMT